MESRANVRVSGIIAVLCIPILSACGQDGRNLARRGFELVGVPEQGYPNYQERLMLVMINRARADPNVEGETKAACSRDYNPGKPFMLSLAGSRCSRFHCANCILNDGGLSHSSYCTLRSDIGDTFENGCNGEASCSCEPGSEHFSCTTLGGNGTSPWTRCGYFGYGASGEVGAAGYSDGADAVWGWMSECAGQDGHRRILTGNYDTIGLGFFQGPTSCWSRLYFGDTATTGVSTYVMPAGVHYPPSGSTVTFYVNYYDTAGPPQSLHLVLDGQCLPMELEIGTAENGTYTASTNLSGGCHSYWFLARTASGQRATWPERGGWGAGSCTDYMEQVPDASCETCNPGETKPCGLGQCAGTKRCNDQGAWEPCDGPAPDPAESCDGVDNDCDGQLPADESDADGDGHMACAGDCDDSDPETYPGATERCNGKDDDCDGSLPPNERDSDGDGAAPCQGDCDDADATVGPAATESCNGRDDDCDGATDEGCSCTDGEVRPCGSDVGACSPGQQRCTGGSWGECEGATGPAEETCNGADDDCDGDLPASEQDADGDGYMACEGDCDDSDPSVNPSAQEACNGIDDDCDGSTDEQCEQQQPPKIVGGCGCSGGGHGTGSSSRMPIVLVAALLLVPLYRKRNRW